MAREKQTDDSTEMPTADLAILVVNPNTTASMTDQIRSCARGVAGPGVHVDAVNPVHGPESIESHYDDAMATPHLLACLQEGERNGYGGFVIACFGDPGLLAAREIVSGPVVGIAEAAMRTATYLGRSFSVVTTLSRVIGHTWEIARRYGVADLCTGIHACEIPVVALETDPHAYAKIRAACQDALDHDRSDAIVLGCAGMADLCDRLTADLGVPVIDGVRAATAEVEGLMRLGLRTAKHGEFAVPPTKRIV